MNVIINTAMYQIILFRLEIIWVNSANPFLNYQQQQPFISSTFVIVYVEDIGHYW